jgi:hypothetical protein
MGAFIHGGYEVRRVIEYANEAIRLTDLARQASTPSARTALLLRAARYRDIANGIAQASDEDDRALERAARHPYRSGGATGRS